MKSTYTQNVYTLVFWTCCLSIIVLVLYCFVYINIYEMPVNHLMWFVFSIFSVCVCHVALSNSCENKQKSFQLSSISMSVLDLYLLCMTLLPWIDKILFSNYKKEHVLFFLFFFYYIRRAISHMFFSEMSPCICSFQSWHEKYQMT